METPVPAAETIPGLDLARIAIMANRAQDRRHLIRALREHLVEQQQWVITSAAEEAMIVRMETDAGHDPEI